MTAAVTPLEALRRLYEVARKVDASESGEFDNALQGELAVVESVLRDAASMEAVGFVSETAVRQLSRGFTATIFPTWNDSDGERIGLYAAPVVPVAAQPVVPDAIKNAFVTLVHNGGRFSIILKFNQNSDSCAVHEFLLRAGGKEYNVAAQHIEAQPAGEVAQSGPNAALVAITEEQLSRVARYISDRSAEECGVDKDDSWKIYGNAEIENLRAALASAGIEP